MNKIIVNEQQYVEDVLNTQEKPDVGFYHFLNLLSKYYASNSDNIKEVVKNVNFQMKKLYKEEYIEEKWYTYINQIFIKVKKEIISLSKRQDVVIYTWDMRQVFKGETDRERKLLFSAYVTAHYMMCDGWISTKTRKGINDWFEMANVACTNSEKFKLLGEMKRKGLIETTKQCDNLNVKVPMLSDYFGETPVFRITDMRNLGNLLLATYKDGYKQCVKCGKLMKVNSNSHTMCKICASKNGKTEPKKEKIV